MNELTIEETFNLRKAIIEKFGLTEQGHDIWFKVILPNSQIVERLKKRLKELQQTQFGNEYNPIEELQKILGEEK